MKTYEEILTAMSEKYISLTGFSPDSASDIGIRMKVLATVCTELFEELSNLQRELFAQTATGLYLTMHAQTRGIVRKQAVPSSGVLRFSRDTAALSDIIIPQRTICACPGSSQLRFATTKQAVLLQGETSVEIAAQAQSGGEDSNTAANTITVLVTPPQGISRVTNPFPFTGGAAEESDSQLRKRLIDSYNSISNGTNAAFYRNQAMQVDAVNSVHVIPRARGRGTVDIVIADESGTASSQLVDQIQRELEEKREIGVDVLVKSAEILPVDLSLTYACSTGYGPEQTAESCAAAVEQALSSYQIAQPLYLCDLYAILYGMPQLSSYIFTNFSDINPQPTQILRLHKIVMTCGSECFTRTFGEANHEYLS